jgi:putative membrane protein
MSGIAAGVLGLLSVQASAAVPSPDRNFAVKAASGGLAEIQSAQLAQQQGSSPQVKQFAQRMITDHTQANNDLQQIAQQESIDLPTQPTQQEMSGMKRLRGMNGSAFDRSYAQEEVRDHQQDVALFSQEANSGKDPALKAFAQKTLPTLRQHLQLAQAMNSNSR